MCGQGMRGPRLSYAFMTGFMIADCFNRELEVNFGYGSKSVERDEENNIML